MRNENFCNTQVDKVNLYIQLELVVLGNLPDKAASGKSNFPPKITFKTKACHPNVDGTRHVCL